MGRPPLPFLLQTEARTGRCVGPKSARSGEPIAVSACTVKPCHGTCRGSYLDQGAASLKLRSARKRDVTALLSPSSIGSLSLLVLQRYG